MGHSPSEAKARSVGTGHSELAGGQAGTRSVIRALEVLEFLAEMEEPQSLTGIAKKLGIPKTSCLYLLRGLNSRQFVCQNAHGDYGLGVRSFEVGASYLRTLNPVQVVLPELRSLTRTLGMTSHFAVLDAGTVIYLAKHDPPGSGPRLASALGARLPAALTAVGRAQLAFSDLNCTSAELDLVRVMGYAVDKEETMPGIRCVAAPIFDIRGCCGAIGVSYVSQGGPPATVVAVPVVEGAKRATATLAGFWKRSA